MQILAQHHIRPNLLQYYQTMYNWEVASIPLLYENYSLAVSVLMITEIIFSSTIKLSAHIPTPNQMHAENDCPFLYTYYRYLPCVIVPFCQAGLSFDHQA